MTLIKNALNQEPNTHQIHNLLPAVTADATSNEVVVTGAKRISFWFKRSNHSSGSSAFTVEGTIDGTNWVTLNFIIEHNTNTNAQDYVRAASVTLSSDTDALAFLDLAHMGLYQIRVKVDETTDGTHDARALIEF